MMDGNEFLFDCLSCFWASRSLALRGWLLRKKKNNHIAVWDCVSGGQWPVGRHWAQLNSVGSIDFSFARINQQLVSEKRPQRRTDSWQINDKISKSLRKCSCCVCYVPSRSHKWVGSRSISCHLLSRVICWCLAKEQLKRKKPAPDASAPELW